MKWLSLIPWACEIFDFVCKQYEFLLKSYINNNFNHLFQLSIQILNFIRYLAALQNLDYGNVVNLYCFQSNDHKSMLFQVFNYIRVRSTSIQKILQEQILLRSEIYEIIILSINFILFILLVPFQLLPLVHYN